MPSSTEKKVVISHGKLALGAMALVVTSVAFTSVAGVGGALRGNLTFFGGGSIPSSGFSDAEFYSSQMRSMSAAMQSLQNSSFSSYSTSYSLPNSSASYSAYSTSYSMPYSSSSMSSFSSSAYSMPYSSSSMTSYSSSAYSIPNSSSSMTSYSSSAYSIPNSSSSMTSYSSSAYSIPNSSSSMTSYSSSTYSIPNSSSSMTSMSSSAFSMPNSSSSMTSFSSSAFSIPNSSSSMTSFSSSAYSIPNSSSSMTSYSSSAYSMPFSSSSMSMYSSAASAPYAPLMNAIASSVSAETAQEVSPSLRSAAALAIEEMAPVQAELALRLATQLTLTPQVATQVYQFIAADLPVMPMTQQSASAVFTDFKLNNGAELKAANLTPAIDVDPKDWYAPVVVEVQMMGVMQGNPVSGLFEPERLMNQAEFAKTLANAVTKAADMSPHAAAPVSGAFDRYPAWATKAIAVLKSYDIPTSFFRAEPTESVTRLQLAQGIASALFDDAEVSTAGAKYFKDINAIPMQLRDTVRTVSALGIMTGDGKTGNFDPYRFANRAEVAKVFATAMRIKAQQISAEAAR